MNEKIIETCWMRIGTDDKLYNATKTQLVHTAFASDWKHFIQLRSDGVSGAPHPNAKILGDQVKQLLNL